MRQLNFNLINSSTPSATVTTGNEVDSQNLFACSAQGVTTGTITGSMQLQASNDVSSPSHWSNVGSPVYISAASTALIPKTDLTYQWTRVAFALTSTGVQTITTVADVAGSLNNKYFFINGAQASGGNAYYVWFNVSSGGTDPMVPGKIGIEVAIVTGDTASDVATALAAELNSGDWTATALAAVVTVTNAGAGAFVPAVDNNTGFAFAVTAGAGTISINMKALGA